MKINVLSDLHLSVGALDRPANDADVVVLAGDISRPRQAVDWALGFDKPVLYVPGNHEFYGGSIDGTIEELKVLCAGTHVHLLDGGEVVLGNVRFVGATLWTDFELFAEPRSRVQAIDQALRLSRDFSRIRLNGAASDLFTPADSVSLFRRDASWLDSSLRAPHGGPTVVITHHAPSPMSVHPRYAGSLLNASFVSDAEHLLGAHRASLWIHGHTHDSFDYQVNGTRVVCNPRGYSREGVNENPLFDPDLIVEVNEGVKRD